MQTNESLLIRALRGEKTREIPVWYMRQAGRYLPEYNELRAGRSFLELSGTVELAVEVSLQPWRRFGMDGVILFQDILTPLHGAGVPLHFEEKVGPVLERTVESESDLDMLTGFEAARDTAHVARVLQQLRSIIADADFPNEISRQRGKPALLGFAGAPFTLASYLIEGGTSRRFEKTKAFAFGRSALFQRLCEILADMQADYLRMQLEAGAEAVQIFDSWGGMLSPADYREFAAPYTWRILDRLRDTGKPVILFVGGGSHLLPDMIAQAPEAISLDWRIQPADAVKSVPDYIALQGNLDPLILYGESERVRTSTERILRGFSAHRGYVFNLGHGIHPQTPIENVQVMLDTVRAFQREI